MAIHEKYPKDITGDGGIPKPTWSNSVRGAPIKPETAQRIAAAIGCKLEDLLETDN